MAIVAGVDFGTQSVRVSLFDSAKGRLGSAVAEYAVIRKREDPDHATQRHVGPHAGAGGGDARGARSGGRGRRGGGGASRWTRRARR